MNGACQETAGFLFSHTCGKPAQYSCGRCGKITCLRHGHMAEGQVVCTSCAKAMQSQAPGRHPGAFSNSPYFYAHYHYPGYGYYHAGYWGSDIYDDPYDFSPADGESLSGAEGEGFEMDMGGS